MIGFRKILIGKSAIKRLVSTLLVFAVMVGIFGCSSSTPGPSQSGPNSSVSKNSSNKTDANKNSDSSSSQTPANIPPSTSENKADSGQAGMPSENKPLNGQLKVSYIDVGQADSILIQQGGNNMLIDAGNNADANTVVNYIKQQGISKLDYVVGTHPHEDHIGGLDAVINKFNIGTIYMPKVTSNTATFKDVITSIKNKSLTITTPTPGATFKLGDVVCTILAPNSSSYNDLNDYSIVIRLTYGNTSFLFSGDASAVSEMEMVKKGYNLKADVLKVGHHGSKTSSCANYLDAVKPKYAVISVGKGNDYGHPEASTLSRLQSTGINIFRTDEAGTVICTSDGKNISFNF